MAHPRSRLQREARTLEAMIRIYCRTHHTGKPSSEGHHFCESCARLLEYARGRLARCPYQEAKPTCARCPIHCYQPKHRAEIRTVMRYAGPRMLGRHPYLAIRHLLDGFRKPASKSAPKSGSGKPSHK